MYCKEYLLKINNFEIPVLPCTVLGALGYKEHSNHGKILPYPDMFLIVRVHYTLLSITTVYPVQAKF